MKVDSDDDDAEYQITDSMIAELNASNGDNENENDRDNEMIGGMHVNDNVIVANEVSNVDQLMLNDMCDGN